MIVICIAISLLIIFVIRVIWCWTLNKIDDNMNNDRYIIMYIIIGTVLSLLIFIMGGSILTAIAS